MLQSPFSSHLAAARDPRSLISAVKDVEAKLEPLEMEVVNNSHGEQAHSPSAASASAEDHHNQNGGIN